MQKKILLVGGGTGGHVFPLLNLIKYLQKNYVSSSSGEFNHCVAGGNENPEIQSKNDSLIHLDTRVKPEYDEQIQFHWIGESSSIESRVAAENGIPFSPIICGKLRRYFSLITLLLPIQKIIGIIQSGRILLREKPTAIFSKGGFVSLPVTIAGWIMKIPVYLHESDSIPGLANRIVGRFARGIFCAFTEADSFFDAKKILGHGPLLSEEIQKISSSGDGSPGQARGGQTQILVSCGSQGSASIFDAVLDILKNQNKAPQSPGQGGEKNGKKGGGLEMGVNKENEVGGFYFHVVLGVKNLDYRAKFEKFPNVTTYDFFYDQTEYLKVVQKCDLVIARSGSSIFEFEALGLHMILIPHPHTGNNHQYWNARAFEKKGHELLEQKNISELGGILEKYRDFKKSEEKIVVDMTIFDTITQILLK